MKFSAISGLRGVDLTLGLLLLGSSSAYFWLGRQESPFLGLLAIFTLQFAIFGGMARRIPRMGSQQRCLWIAIGVLCRILLWFTPAVLENDFYRYLWDGRGLAHGVNPYLHTPLDPALDFLDVQYRHSIGWPQFGTIYPPFSELVFGFTHLLAPDSVIGLKIVLSLFDLGTAALLFSWLKLRGNTLAWGLLYLLNPLVLKEIANSAHLDSIAIFFTTAALYCLEWSLRSSRPRIRTLAWAFLAVATGSKLYPIVLLPLFAKLDRQRKKNLMLFVCLLGSLYLPFLSAGWKLLGGTQAYAKYWIFNAGIFQVTTLALTGLLSKLAWIIDDPVLSQLIKNDYPAKVLVGSAFMVGLIWRVRKLQRTDELPSAALWILGLLLLLSPVVDAWYVLWILPLACLTRSAPWLAFSYLVVASYAWHFSKENAYLFRIVEYGVFFTLFIFESRFRPRLSHALHSTNRVRTVPTSTES